MRTPSPLKLALLIAVSASTLVARADETPAPEATPAPTPVASKATSKAAAAPRHAKPVAAQPLSQLIYKDEKGEAHTDNVRLSLVKENDLSLIAMDWKLPWSDVKSVTETDANGADNELTLNAKADGPHVELISAKAKLTIVRAAGPTKISYELQKTSGLLHFDKSCRKAGLKLKAMPATSAIYPAVLVCKVVPNSTSPVEIIFSTMKDADWLGSDAFEIGGKGERYKTFSYGDASALINWHVNWGSSDQHISYQVTFPNVMIPKPATPVPSTTFEVGLGYILGTFMSSGASASLSGLEIPLSVVYKKPSSIWFVGGGYDLFLYSLEKTAAGSSTTSLLQVWGGVEQRFSSFGLQESLGIVDRSLSLPDVGLNANFQAPKLALTLFREGRTSLISARVGYATTATGGHYNELNANLSYTFTRPNHQKRARIGLTLEQMQASQDALTANGQSYLLEFGFDF